MGKNESRRITKKKEGGGSERVKGKRKREERTREIERRE